MAVQCGEESPGVWAGSFFLSAEQRLKAAIIGWMVLVDAWWIYAAGYHFKIDGLLIVISAMAALLVIAQIYRAAGHDPDLVVITRETAWLLAFTGAAALLSNLAITTDLPLIDPRLAWFSRAVGYDWPQWYSFVTGNRLVGWGLSAAYVIALPEIAIVMVMLAHAGKAGRASELVLAAMIGAILAIAVSTAFPSAGALVYYKPDQSGVLVRPIVDLAYKATFFDLRAGRIHSFSLSSLKGLIAFPSYHAVLCVVTLLATRGMPRLFWPLFAVSLLILASAPIEGGHFLADVIGGVAVGVVATVAAATIRKRAAASAGEHRAAELPPLAAGERA